MGRGQRKGELRGKVRARAGIQCRGRSQPHRSRQPGWRHLLDTTRNNAGVTLRAAARQRQRRSAAGSAPQCQLQGSAAAAAAAPPRCATPLDAHREVDEHRVAKLLGKLVGPILNQPAGSLLAGQALLGGLQWQGGAAAAGQAVGDYINAHARGGCGIESIWQVGWGQRKQDAMRRESSVQLQAQGGAASPVVAVPLAAGVASRLTLRMDSACSSLTSLKSISCSASPPTATAASPADVGQMGLRGVHGEGRPRPARPQPRMLSHATSLDLPAPPHRWPPFQRSMMLHVQRCLCGLPGLATTPAAQMRCWW